MTEEKTKSRTLELPVKTLLTVLLAVLILWVLPLIPGLHAYGRLEPVAELIRAGTLPPWPGKRTVKPQPPLAKKPPLPSAEPLNAAGFTPAMLHFEQALARTQAKEPGAITRVLHFGDSPVTADLITADLRSEMQARFGNAGHGFVLIVKPWAWYGHRGVELNGHGWTIESATMSRAKDGIHGLGGVSFRGSVGARSSVRLNDPQSTVEVQYLEQPEGGTFRLSSGDRELGVVSTDGPEKKPAFASFVLPDASTEVNLEVVSGNVRAFGYHFEKSGPGVIYSSLGLNGGQVQAVLRYFEPNQWTAELRHANPDLVVINYGTNESEFPKYIEKDYPGELRKVVARVRAAVPDASVLIMSPMDRGEWLDGEVATIPVLPRIVETQRKVAAEMGCAFFDTFDAMGGAGTMAQWYSAQPRLVSGDFTHPFPKGAEKVARLVDGALMQGFDRFEHSQVERSREKIAAAPPPGRGEVKR